LKKELKFIQFSLISKATKAIESY